MVHAAPSAATQNIPPSCPSHCTNWYAVYAPSM